MLLLYHKYSNYVNYCFYFRLEIQFIKTESKKMIEKLEEQITALETELATRESELIQERQLKEDLFQQATATQNHDSERRYYSTNFCVNYCFCVNNTYNILVILFQKN